MSLLTELQPKSRSLSIVEQDPYWANLRMTRMSDKSISDHDAGGQCKDKIEGMNMNKGSYRKINVMNQIQDRINIRRMINNTVTITEAKLPKPVKVSNINIIRQQPAINIADVEYTMLDDLNNVEQEDVLGENRLDFSIRGQNVIIEKLKNIQMQNPILIPNVGSNKKQLLKMIN